MSLVANIKTFLIDYQRQLCQALAELDGHQTFLQDAWQRAEGGGGLSCVLENGAHIEKGGVNFSHIRGHTLPMTASNARQDWQGASFEALGVSIVIHPTNPHAPTSHCNVRYFKVTKASGQCQAWFGGGFDLTPYYGYVEDCQLWHTQAQLACQPFGDDVYPLFKKQCDAYFYLPHRGEARGIGGLFFDDLHTWGDTACFAFMQKVALHYQQAYLAILERRIHTPYTPKQRDFQSYRRGRYTEFNLLYDRGTLFGLQSGGRTESILMSLPPLCHYHYNYQPEAGSAEAQLTTEFLAVQDWLTVKDSKKHEDEIYELAPPNDDVER